MEDVVSMELCVCDILGIDVNDSWFVDVGDFEELIVVLGEADKDI